MNERIRELADEAAKYSAIMALPTGQSGNELFVAKFAELIVRECVELLPPDMTHGPDGRPFEQVFKQHFGVNHV